MDGFIHGSLSPVICSKFFIIIKHLENTNGNGMTCLALSITQWMLREFSQILTTILHQKLSDTKFQTL